MCCSRFGNGSDIQYFFSVNSKKRLLLSEVMMSTNLTIMKPHKVLKYALASLFWFVSITASAFTLADGDIVTIKSGTYYLCVEGTNYNSPVVNKVTVVSENCFWRVSMTSPTESNL